MCVIVHMRNLRSHVPGKLTHMCEYFEALYFTMVCKDQERDPRDTPGTSVISEIISYEHYC